MLKNKNHDCIIAREISVGKTSQNEGTHLDRHPWGISRRAIKERYFNPVNPMALLMNKGKTNHLFN